MIWKLIQLYDAVYYVCMQALSILLWSSSTCVFHHFAFNSVYRYLSKSASINNMFWSFPFPFCLPNLEDCELAIFRHLISCVCLLLCWATKDNIILKQYSLFLKKEICYRIALHAGHVWFYFLFFVLEDVLLSDDSSMAFILHLWPHHFFGTATKKWQDLPPLAICTSAFQLCWSAPPLAVIRLQWMHYNAFIVEVDRRASGCDGR